jgi:hypothetical protein
MFPLYTKCTAGSRRSKSGEEKFFEMLLTAETLTQLTL